MHTLNDVHQQFAEYFANSDLKPYAYLLSRKLSEGHICLYLDKIGEESEGLAAYCNNMRAGSGPLASIALVGKDGDDEQPFVLYQDRLYLQRYFRYETNFLHRIQQFLTSERSLLEERSALLQANKPFISSLFGGENPLAGNSETDTQKGERVMGRSGPGLTADETERPDWQLAAAVTGVLNNFTIITGGPGTGKTTTVAKILAILYATDADLKVALAAPTGKAAARMAESLRNTKLPVDDATIEKFQNLSPSTIHRLLKPVADTPYFRYNANNSVNYDVVIIDECSMIDVALFAKLVGAIGPGTRLILLGDKDQLASVEAGSLFGDLCQAQERLNLFSAQRLGLINDFIPDPRRRIPAGPVSKDERHPLFEHLVELRHSHRFRGDRGIGKFSRAVIGNEEAVLQEFLTQDSDGQVVIDQSYSRELFEKFVSGYEAFISEKDIRLALRKMNTLRVLCAIREGEQGLYAVNTSIEKYLQEKKMIKVNTGFYENRPIIITRNYYEHGLFNGDTGIIRPDEKGALMAWFEDSSGELRAVLPGWLVQAETVFAMTIHKSQGSEFDEVLVVLPKLSETPILTRELLYTAVTRARKRVYVQGSGSTMLMAAQRYVERASGIAARFQTGQ